MKRTHGWMKGLGLVACAFAIVLGTAWAQGKPENSVVVYSAADSDMVNAVTAAFEKKYPGVKASTVVAGTGEIIKRMEAEKERPLGDVGWSFGPEAIRRRRLLLLDEPFDGLDADARSRALSLVDGAVTDGAALVLATHHRSDLPHFIDHELRLERGHGRAGRKRS